MASPTADTGAPEYVTTIRLPMPMYEEVRLAAKAEGHSVSEEIRIAIAAYIVKRRSDPEFQKRLKDRIKRDAALLARLSTDRYNPSPNDRSGTS